VGVFNLGLTTQLTTPAPPGTYFVRVRAGNACGTGPASNEATLVVGCTAPPGAPASLNSTVIARVVTIGWSAASGQPTSYVLEAGVSPGSTGVGIFDVGNQLSITTGAPPGTYFVRVRARNACGTGPPTSELTIVVP
jgi:hypothetical protein